MMLHSSGLHHFHMQHQGHDVPKPLKSIKDPYKIQAALKWDAELEYVSLW